VPVLCARLLVRFDVPICCDSPSRCACLAIQFAHCLCLRCLYCPFCSPCTTVTVVFGGMTLTLISQPPRSQVPQQTREARGMSAVSVRCVLGRTGLRVWARTFRDSAHGGRRRRLWRRNGPVWVWAVARARTPAHSARRRHAGHGGGSPWAWSARRATELSFSAPASR
jgi:hypothetical protein